MKRAITGRIIYSLWVSSIHLGDSLFHRQFLLLLRRVQRVLQLLYLILQLLFGNFLRRNLSKWNRDSGPPSDTASHALTTHLPSRSLRPHRQNSQRERFIPRIAGRFFPTCSLSAPYAPSASDLKKRYSPFKHYGWLRARDFRRPTGSARPLLVVPALGGGWRLQSPLRLSSGT